MGLLFERFDSKKDLQKQRNLFVECFPENIGTSVESVSHYSWKFHSGPFNPHSFEYVARNDEDEFVGYYAALPYPYSINGTFTSAGMVCDVMTGVKARGKGVFTKLGSFATEELSKSGIPFTTGYPIRKEVIPGHLKVGWKIAFDLPLYIKVLKVNNISVFKKLKFLSPLVNGVMNLFYSIQNPKIKNYTVKVISPSEIDSLLDYNEFFAAWSRQIPNHLVKSTDFLKWRLSAPRKAYKIIAIYKNDSLAGIAITTKTTKEGIPCLAIMDLMVSDFMRNNLGVLHFEIEKLAKKERLDAILVMTSSYWATQYKFLRNGYLRSQYKFVLIIKKLTQQFTEEQLFNLKNWHLMWIDSDDL